MTDIGGQVEPGFEGVRDAFLANFAEHGDVGAATAMYVEGRKVVDLWGGVADPDSGRAYDRDTLQSVFSTTKGATATCAHLLAQRGELDLDAPVATYWPEFAQNGKEAIPVKWLLTHQAGLPYVDEVVTYEGALGWDEFVRALEVQAPVWEPGTQHGYHAVTYGHLVGEVIRRVSGKSVGAFFRDEVAAPLGLEFWIGLPESEHHRVAPLIGGLAGDVPDDPAIRELIAQFMGPDTLLGKALGAPSGVFSESDTWNRPEVRSAEIPAANGVTNARSLARMYAGIIGKVEDGPGGPLLTAEQLELATTRQTSGSDAVIMMETTIGLGYWTASVFAPYGGARSFGHGGAGGSLGFADPENDLGFGYVMNKMQAGLSGDPRTRTLIKALYDAVGAEAVYV